MILRRVHTDLIVLNIIVIMSAKKKYSAIMCKAIWGYMPQINDVEPVSSVASALPPHVLRICPYLL